MTTLPPQLPPQPPPQRVAPTPPDAGEWLEFDGHAYPSQSTAPQGPFVVAPKTGNGMAVAALTLGVVGVFLGLIPILAVPALICGLLAVIFGFVGLSAARRTPGRSGQGMAIAGVALGTAAIGLSIVGFVIVANAFN